MGFPPSSVGKESACNAGDLGFNSWVGKIPWRRKWQPTPVFLSGKPHGQKSLAGYSSWGCRVGRDLGTKPSQHTYVYVYVCMTFRETVCDSSLQYDIS